MADCTRSKIPTSRKVKLSSKGRKRNLSPRKQKHKPERGRVDIGPAFDAWRSMKAAKGWKSDAEVAVRLMDITKTLPTRPAARKVKFSQSEMQALVEQEVEATVQRKEAKLQSVMETIQQLDRDVDYEHTIKRLENRINIISKRAEAAMAFMKTTQKKSPLPSFVKVNITRLNSQDITMKTAPQSESPAADKESPDCVAEKGEVFMMMEHTKQALKKMKSDNEALKGAMADLREERPPPVLTPYGSPEALEIKPKEEQKMEPCVEPEAGPVKVESGGPDPADPEQVQPLFPPLPTNTFPSTLHMSAALYNIPQKPQVRLALIRNPPGISVLWNAVEDDPSRPPMGSYSVYMSVEVVKGSNVFPDWTCSQVDAKPLPMLMMISKYKPGRKVCVAVVGKDKFGRFGPYSSIATASLPESAGPE